MTIRPGDRPLSAAVSLALCVFLLVSPALGAASLASPPDAAFTYSPEKPRPDEQVVLDASETTDDGTIAKYEWDTDGDEVYGEDEDAPNGQTTTFSFDTGGTFTVGLKVTDSEGNTDTVRKRIVVPNAAPSASFYLFPSDPRPDEEVVLNAGGSNDSDGTIVRYEWDTDGDGVYGEPEDAPSGQATTYTFDTAGNHTIGLRVVDNGGKNATVRRTVTIKNTPPKPSFSYTVDQSGLSARFDAGNASDPDGSITSYTWFVDGQEVATGRSPTIEFESKGSYTVRLMVTDNAGATANLSRTVGLSRPPVASIEVSRTLVGPDQTITFSGEPSSDPDGSIERYEWVFPDGAASGATVERSFPAVGNYTVTLRVTDDLGTTATANVTVRVKRPPRATVTWEPERPADDAVVRFEASSPDEIRVFRWDFDGDGTFEANGSRVEHRFPDGGQAQVTMKAVGPGGVSNVITRTVEVRDVKPTAAVTWRPEIPAPGYEVVFRAKSNDTIAEYGWDFNGDGEIDASGQRVTHTFNGTGERTVELYVTDEFGDEARIAETLTVRRSGVFGLSADRSNIDSGGEITVTLSVENRHPEKPMAFKLALNVSAPGVSVTGVGGAEGVEVAGDGETTFVTIDPGQSGRLEVTVRFANAGNYDVDGKVIYYVGSRNSGQRRTSDVGPVSVSVAYTQTPTLTSTTSPGLGSMAAVVSVLLGALAFARRR